jgi:hypothetical protein
LTPDASKSAITVPTLKLFHAVSLHGKTTICHFFDALAKLTDNTGSRAFKVSFPKNVRAWPDASTGMAASLSAGASRHVRVVELVRSEAGRHG